MSEFEREMINRIPDFQRRQAEARQREEMDLQRIKSLELQAQRKEEQVRAMGMEVAQLLQKYEIAPEPVWALEVTGKHTYYRTTKSGGGMVTEDRRDYVKRGEGWRIYKVVGYDPDMVGSGSFTSSVGLDETGRVFDIENFKVPADRYNDRNKMTHEGLCVARYPAADRAEYTLQSGYFKDGIASLISGNGPLGG
jgi:hypothetical protein